jgi:hypothetical protein
LVAVLAHTIVGVYYLFSEQPWCVYTFSRFPLSVIEMSRIKL